MTLTIRDTLALGCKDLLLENFIKCLLNSDTSFLVKKKGILRAKKDIAHHRWLEIYQEFTDAGESYESVAYLSLLKQRTILNNRIDVLENGLKSLTYGYSADLVAALKSIGLKINIRKESLGKDLERAIKYLKSMVGTLSRIDRNLAPFLEGEAMKEGDFEEVLAVLSKFQGYRLRADEITVSEYIHVLNSYKKWQTPKK